MSKAKFVDRVSKNGKLSKAEAKRLVDLVFEEIKTCVKQARKDGKSAIGTVGTFYMSERKARRGRNPRTGELIKIKATKVLKFRPSINLKKAAGLVRG